MGYSVREPDLTALTDSAKTALVDCEALLKVLGIGITIGGEVEFYFAGIDTCPEIDPKIAADEIRALSKQHYEAFGFGLFTGMPMDDLALLEGETMEEFTIKRVDYYIARRVQYGQMPAAVGLALARSAVRFHESGIQLYTFHSESGQLFSDEVVPPPKTVALQFELATGIDSPTQSVQKLEMINKILSEEAEKLGLQHAHESLPNFAYIMNNDGDVNLRTHPNSRHLHFGAIFIDDGQNAFQNSQKQDTVISRQVTKSTINLTLDGGLALANVKRNDMMRLRHRAGAVPIFFSNIHYKQGAIVEVEKPGEKKHKEFRMAGAGTPPAASILVPVLGVVDALLTLLGKEIEATSFIGNILNKSESMDLKSITARLTPDDAKILRAGGLTGVNDIRYDSGFSVDNMSAITARNTKLKAYVPEVAAALKELSAFIG